MPFGLAKAHQSSGQVKLLNPPGGNPYFFVMRVDKPPFADVRVRQAMSLLIDRQALVEEVFDGFGSVGNNLFGVGLPYFDASLTVGQDVEQAKSLLKAAGQSGLTVTLETSESAVGLNESAAALAEQAKAAGVNINIHQTSPTTYYTAAGGYETRVFSTDEAGGGGFTSLDSYNRAWLISGAPYNETHWGGTDKLAAEAIGATDSGKAAQAWAEVQAQQAHEVACLIWGNGSYLDGLAPHVEGLQGSQVDYCGEYRFRDAWIGS
jgi:peptide/nickel transport system substrate-binding protein